jgi:hypothetical protein
MPKDETSVEPDSSDPPLGSFTSPGTAFVFDCAVYVNTSQQVHVRVEFDTTITVKILVRGWIDRRGQDD